MSLMGYTRGCCGLHEIFVLDWILQCHVLFQSQSQTVRKEKRLPLLITTLSPALSRFFFSHHTISFSPYSYLMKQKYIIHVQKQAKPRHEWIIMPYAHLLALALQKLSARPSGSPGLSFTKPVMWLLCLLDVTVSSARHRSLRDHCQFGWWLLCVSKATIFSGH